MVSNLISVLSAKFTPKIAAKNIAKYVCEKKNINR